MFSVCAEVVVVYVCLQEAKGQYKAVTWQMGYRRRGDRLPLYFDYLPSFAQLDTKLQNQLTRTGVQ